MPPLTAASQTLYGSTLVGGEDGDLRSLRAWINTMYPTADILLQRDSSRRSKPWFFLEHVDDKFQDRGRGWHDQLRTWKIHLVSEGPQQGSPATPATLHGTRRVLDMIVARLTTERVVPRYAYNLTYPPPRASYIATGGTFPGGAHRFGITAIDWEGRETLLSEPELALTVSNGTTRIFLQVPNWPTQQPLAHLYWVWHRVGATDPWAPIGSVAPVVNQRYSTEIEVGPALTPVARDPLPTECRLRLGYLKVQDAQATMSESFLDDNAFHGFVTLRALSRSYHVRPVAPPLNGIATAINMEVV